MYLSLQEIIDLEQETGIPFWELIRREECEETKISPEKLFEQMRNMYREMKQADADYDPSLRSHSGLAGAGGQKMAADRQDQGKRCGGCIHPV